MALPFYYICVDVDGVAFLLKQFSSILSVHAAFRLEAKKLLNCLNIGT